MYRVYYHSVLIEIMSQKTVLLNYSEAMEGESSGNAN